MHNVYYPFLAASSFEDFEFQSVGPRGIIRKVARFTHLEDEVYNFGFGDWDEGLGKVNDETASKNADSEKIFFTLGRIILDFTSAYPERMVFISGTDDIRTRLYQMNISRYWKEIEPLFNVVGYRDNDWQPFQHNHNYKAFLFWPRKA